MPPVPPSPASPGTPTDPPGSQAPATGQSQLTIGALEAGYSLYCKALRLLIQQGRSLATIQRTLCWHRLARLHASLPGQYKDPDYLYLQFRRRHSEGGS
jgi:hypothetical protein